jgi:hypothetical protein
VTCHRTSSPTSCGVPRPLLSATSPPAHPGAPARLQRVGHGPSTSSAAAGSSGTMLYVPPHRLLEKVQGRAQQPLHLLNRHGFLSVFQVIISSIVPVLQEATSRAESCVDTGSIRISRRRRTYGGGSTNELASSSKHRMNSAATCPMHATQH